MYIPLQWEGKIEDFHHYTIGLSLFASPLGAVCASLRSCLFGVPYQYLWRWHRNGSSKCHGSPPISHADAATSSADFSTSFPVRLGPPSCCSPLQTKVCPANSSQNQVPQASIPCHTCASESFLKRSTNTCSSKSILPERCSARIAHSASAPLVRRSTALAILTRRSGYGGSSTSPSQP